MRSDGPGGSLVRRLAPAAIVLVRSRSPISEPTSGQRDTACSGRGEGLALLGAGADPDPRDARGAARARGAGPHPPARAGDHRLDRRRGDHRRRGRVGSASSTRVGGADVRARVRGRDRARARPARRSRAEHREAHRRGLRRAVRDGRVEHHRPAGRADRAARPTAASSPPRSRSRA